MIVSYFDAPVSEFLNTPTDEILGQLARAHTHTLDHLQRNAWIAEIEILKDVLAGRHGGHLFLEFFIPRMGKRADAVFIAGNTVHVVEFKVGAKEFDRGAIDQVHDYALDLKNFHLGSHDLPIVPILVATKALSHPAPLVWAADSVAEPLLVSKEGLRSAFPLQGVQRDPWGPIDVAGWPAPGYRPTPTFIEAAEALYQTHSVLDISRSDAGAMNLQATAKRIADIIETSKYTGRKSICFITGVPGAG